MIQVECSECGAKLKVKDELAGRSGKCPKCGARVQIPAAAPAEIAVPDLSGFVGDIVDPDGELEAAAAVSEEPAAEDAYDPSGEVIHAAEETPPADDSDEPIPFDSLFDDDGEESTPIIIRAEGGLGAIGSGGDETAEREFDDTIAPEDVPVHLGVRNHYMVCDHKDVVARYEHDDRGWMVKLKDGFVRAKLVSGKIPQFGKFVLVEVGVKQTDDGLHLESVNPFRLADQYALNKLAKDDDAILTAITGRAELNTAQKSHVRDLVKKHFLPHVAAEVDQFMK
ncbi:MAG: hypothetical protein MI757_06275 [Pirellulales bacterium]|nr:hypothetical protein [Pirellulales bacterium]